MHTSTHHTHVFFKVVILLQVCRSNFCMHFDLFAMFVAGIKASEFCGGEHRRGARSGRGLCWRCRSRVHQEAVWKRHRHRSVPLGFSPPCPMQLLSKLFCNLEPHVPTHRAIHPPTNTVLVVDWGFVVLWYTECHKLNRGVVSPKFVLRFSCVYMYHRSQFKKKKFSAVGVLMKHCPSFKSISTWYFGCFEQRFCYSFAVTYPLTTRVVGAPENTTTSFLHFYLFCYITCMMPFHDHWA